MAIDTRLLAAMLPIAAATISRRRENPQHVEDFWERVHAVAPEPVWQYFCQIDAECQVGQLPKLGSSGFDADAWLKRHHPAFDDVLEGLARAVQKFGISPDATQILTFTQGWTIQWASARLGMVYATERPGAGITTSVVIDRVVQERAAHDLLGWTVAEVHRQWADPCAFAEQWRSTYTAGRVDADMLANVYAGVYVSADILAKAGLFDAELALLEAVEE